jgi:hypothetical protein
VSFDAPATRPLSCDTDEVVTWKAQADDFRGKKDIIAKQVGKEQIVKWTEEDSDLSMTTWDNEFRICVVTNFIAHQQQFVLQFKCGYEKVVKCEDFIHMLDESCELAASTRKRTYNKVLTARAERSVPPAAASSVARTTGLADKSKEAQDVAGCTIANNDEAPHKNHGQRKSDDAAKIARQRAAVFDMQQAEGQAARDFQDAEDQDAEDHVLEKQGQDELLKLANVVAVKTRAVESATEALQKHVQDMPNVEKLQEAATTSNEDGLQ